MYRMNTTPFITHSSYSELAGMIVANATLLEEQLVLLSEQQMVAEATANDTQQLVEGAEDVIERVRDNTWNYIAPPPPPLTIL